MKCPNIHLAFAVGIALVICTATANAQSIIRVKPDGKNANNGSTWARAKRTVWAALAQAASEYKVSGDSVEIWVAAGKYTPTDGTSRSATLRLKNGVALYGGFAGSESSRDLRNWRKNVTTLSGDIGIINAYRDNSYHVVTANGTNPSAVLDGFTITGGCCSGYRDGAGIHNAGGSPTLTNLTIIHNKASSSVGGGMGSENGNPTLTNVSFRLNAAYTGGGMFNENGSPKLTNVTFSENRAYQGGGMSNAGSARLTNVTFEKNIDYDFAGGMFSEGDPTLTNVRFIGNTSEEAVGAGMCSIGGSPNLSNVTFIGNTSALGGAGGMGCYGGTPTLTNVTFNGNSALGGGGAIGGYDKSNIIITNAILWGNRGYSNTRIYHDETSSATVTYSDVQGGYPGTGNIAADPLFVDLSGPDGRVGTADDDLRLRAHSPAIDSANGDVAPVADMDDNPRYDDPDIANTGTGAPDFADMGAYERQTPSGSELSPITLSVQTFPTSLGAHISGYPSGIASYSADCPVGASIDLTAPWKVFASGHQWDFVAWVRNGVGLHTDTRLFFTLGEAGTVVAKYWRVRFLTITGPSRVHENSSAFYWCWATFSDGSFVYIGAPFSENSPYLKFSPNGRLQVASVPRTMTVSIYAKFEGVTAAKRVTIVHR